MSGGTGDGVPGWVLMAVMTAGLVVGVAAVVPDLWGSLSTMFEDMLSNR